MTDSIEKPIQIGQILVEQGVLTDQQVLEIVHEQRKTSTPFGVLAERMFDVTVGSIERAWIEQYYRFTGGNIDLSRQEIDAEALSFINRRQAWQFEILPMRIEPDGELLIAATRKRLARAVTFVTARLGPVAFFRIAESDQLRSFLRKHYPMPEVTEELLRKARQMCRPGNAA